MQLRKIVLFIFGLIQTSVAVLAQESFMRHYSLSNGLPSNTIYRIAQDNDGYIWIGNEFGVSRFNGKTFENFSVADGLSDNEIIFIKKDSKGRIWFLGYNGTVSYWFKNKFYNEKTDTLLKEIKTTYCFTDLFEDKLGKLWFFSISNSKILNGSNVISAKPSEVYQNSFLIEGNNRQIILSRASDHHVVFSANGFRPTNLKYTRKLGCGLVRLPDSQSLFTANEGLVIQFDTIQELLVKYPAEIANSRYISLGYTKDSVIWIAAQFGLYAYDFKGSKKIRKVFHSTSVFCNMFVDQEENIWIGTLDDGIYMLPGLTRNQRIYNTSNGLPNLNCYSLFKADSNKVLVGMAKNQISEINPYSRVVKDISPKQFNPEKIDYIISQNEHTWIIANNHLLHRNKRTHHDHLVLFDSKKALMNRCNSIKGISYSKTKVYIITNFEIFEYNLDSICTTNMIRGKRAPCKAKLIVENLNRSNSIFYDHNKTLWYGSADGLFFYNGKHHRYASNLPYTRINAIWHTSDSLLFVGTHGFGLYIYKNGTLLHHVTQQVGLANNLCRKMIYYKSKIYFATPSGISIITINNQKPTTILNLNKSNLLPSDVVNDLYVNDKEIAVATSNGVVFLSHQTIRMLEQPQPKLILNAMQLPNGLFKFKFDGIYFLSPDDVNYRYRIKQNQDWITTTTNQVEFPFLVAGDYKFEVQTRVHQGKYSNSRFHYFTIYPPFWQKWWFIVLVIMSVVFLLGLLVQKRINLIKKQQAEKMRVKIQLNDLEQQALLTMMNPHFIFNVMNSIQHFINQNNPNLANQYLSDFAKLIRMNLSVSIKKYISLDEEIEYLKLYLSFEKLRFGEQLNYQIRLDPTIDADETTVAVMMIQPFLENAIWHGILPMQTTGEIILEINKHSENLLQICISDNGVGIPNNFLGLNFAQMSEKSHGLNLTFKRLKLLCEAANLEPNISFNHLNPTSTCKGTFVQFLLPFK
jgi:ligand-binding sensor domain-containing protein